MEELTFQTMIAVFEEIFGAFLFWAMVAAAVVVTLAYLYVLIRDRRVGMRKFLIAQLFMPVGAVAAVWFVMVMTDSALRDIGGPVDVIVLLGIAGVGAVGLAILVYTVEALFFRRMTADDTASARGGLGQPAE
jgi:NADH:ubiquinone oxidoreductase subunit K